MDDVLLKKLLKELSDIKVLLMLNVSKAGVTSPEIGKCLGIGDSTVRKILLGIERKKV